MNSPVKVVCHDCDWEKEFPPGGTLGEAELSAKKAKAGHIGGGSRYYSTDGPCEDVEVIVDG